MVKSSYFYLTPKKMAASLNKAQIIGNITRDPEVRQTPNGQTVATIGVATNRKWTNKQTGQPQEEVEFHNVVVWGKLAEICQQYLKKRRENLFRRTTQNANLGGPGRQKKLPHGNHRGEYDHARLARRSFRRTKFRARAKFRSVSRPSGGSAKFRRSNSSARKRGGQN